MSGFVFSEKPIRIERGRGVHLYGDDGTEYLDAGASYGVAAVGHCHPTVVEAIKAQAGELLFVQGSYPTDVRDALYARLADVAPAGLGNVWLCNSGTEANEAAIKFARSATGRETVISTMRGFHGRTLGSLSATWKRKYREPYEPLAGGFDFVPYGDVDELRAAVDEDTAALILEPVQGEGGIHPATESYLAAAREVTEDVGAALILDEIQSGLGRTGRFWAADRAGIEPDVVTCAKGIASGLPLGATLCADWIAEDAGPHGSTFSGNPVVAAAGVATLDVLESESLAENAAAMGDRLLDRLTAADLPVRDVRGTGLMVGVEVKRGANALLRDLALEHRVLALPAGRSVLRLLPPLVIGPDEVDRLADAVVAAVTDRADGEP